MCAWDMIVGLGCALDGSSRCLPAAILQNRTMGGKKKQIVPLRRLCHRFDYARRLSNGKFSSPVESRLDRRIPSTQFSFFFSFWAPSAAIFGIDLYTRKAVAAFAKTTE